MSRKHFVALAEALAAARVYANDPEARLQWNTDVRAIARVLRYFNVNFDRERFLTATGGLFEFSAAPKIPMVEAGRVPALKIG